MARRLRFKDKAPGEVVDYVLDWSTRLGSDTIATSSWAITGNDSTLLVSSDDNDDTTATVVLSGGTLLNTYVCKNTITTDGGRTFEQSALIYISTR